ncbi:MAG: CYTH domain-containing protein [Verrucomicrobiales bacterium]
MALEIERKYLVSGDFKPFAVKEDRIVQGYLSSVPERSVRIRLCGGRGYLTIKGPGNSSGVSRFEWEREISPGEAKELLTLCEPGVIEKTRYLVPAGSLQFEVDEFLGDNAGLIIAEIELTREDESFEKPSWLGAEVTGQPEYYNASLMRKPFRSWASTT